MYLIKMERNYCRLLKLVLLIFMIKSLTCAPTTVPVLTQTGSLIPCDWGSPCPENSQKCELNEKFVPENFVCYQKRPSPEALRLFAQYVHKFPSFEISKLDLNDSIIYQSVTQVAICHACSTTIDCPSGLVCCPNSEGFKSCTVAKGTETHTIIHHLQVGSLRVISQFPRVLERQGSVTLIQSQDQYFLVDSGTGDLGSKIKDELKKLNLDEYKISSVILTHGHPDHFNALSLIPAPIIFGKFTSNGNVFLANQIGTDQRHYMCTKNVFLLSTPGHTNDDHTVMVEDVQNLGRVAIVGDLFINESDLKNEKIWREESANPFVQEGQRKRILCMADFIVPGHGPMFHVTEEMKQNASCL